MCIALHCNALCVDLSFKLIHTYYLKFTYYLKSTRNRSALLWSFCLKKKHTHNRRKRVSCGLRHCIQRVHAWMQFWQVAHTTKIVQRIAFNRVSSIGVPSLFYFPVEYAYASVYVSTYSIARFNGICCIECTDFNNNKTNEKKNSLQYDKNKRCVTTSVGCVFFFIFIFRLITKERMYK